MIPSHIFFKKVEKQECVFVFFNTAKSISVFKKAGVPFNIKSKKRNIMKTE